ncbi:hypothetical protein P280DRAFT_511547 [Massarina eburnea CBS 473.64]|uniref:OPA3-domain-containing protein n=1 Tax=Massarina eburnea CBS 473.64 TaxID=1395130 RepID=A0A6A6RHH9_9PLEO|nr:hypothetical protein P280DRAFT_511547 [Massarina eburnea CBS 473.64]
MSLTLKITSLAVRTLAKPIGNRIKRGAHEHERFRRICVRFAQGLHRLDMRMRLGLLQDPAVIDRQIEKEVKAAEAARRQSQAPTVKTEEETLAEANMTKQEREAARKKIEAASKPRIRPLTEAKAIETGANFISEAFIFSVAVGVIVVEQWRQRRKAQNQRDDIREDLEELQVELKTVKAELEEMKAARHPEPSKGLIGLLKGKGGSQNGTLEVESKESKTEQPGPGGGWLSFWRGNSGAQEVEEKSRAENDPAATNSSDEMQSPSNPPSAVPVTEKE